MDPSELARDVMEAIPGSGSFVRRTRSLASLALSPNRQLAVEASRVVIADIVQPLVDRFDKESCDILAAFMAEVVHAPGSPVASELAALGYPGPQHLIERYGKLRDSSLEETVEEDDIRKVVLISRVDFKGEVAVTSPILYCAWRAFDEAEIELVGPKMNCNLIGHRHRVTRSIMSYSRDTTLSNQLRAWSRLRAKAATAIEGFDPGQWLIVDPDSCMTQFGLLPLTDDRYYRFFESRAYGEGSSATLAELAEDWGNQWFFLGGCEAYPSVVPRDGPENGSFHLAHNTDGLLAAVSFSGDGREQARLGAEFEDKLLELLRNRGYRIVFDRGRVEDDRAVAEARLQSFRGSKRHLRVASDAIRSQGQLVTCAEGLSHFSSWAKWANVYIGYDSAMSQAVGSVGVKSIHISVRPPNQTYRMRWTPTSYSDVVTIPANGSDGPAVLNRVVEELVRTEEDSP